MECNIVKNQLMKTRLTKEYKQRVRKLLSTKLSSKNLILAINVYCVSLLCYSGGLVQWTQLELYNMDVMTRKQLTMHGGFSRKGDIDRLYVPRKLGLISVCYAIEHEKRNLASYVHHSEDFSNWNLSTV